MALAVALLCLVGCASESTKPLPPGAAPPPSETRLLFGGDVMLCREVGRRIRASGDPAHPFHKIAPLLKSADLTFVNLESPFADRGPGGESGLIFRARPEAIAGLVEAGVDVASTANNHARDCGDHGVEYTVSWLRQHNIEPVGSAETAERAHQGVVLARHGIRFGFLGYTYDQSNGNWRNVDERVALADAYAMRRDVLRMRQRADVVIVSMHHGIEYERQPSPAQMVFARMAIDAGASLVIGHHPHVTQPVEYYRGGAIFYSLGNLVFDQFQRAETQRGAIADVRFLGTQLASVELIPVRITHDGPEVEASAAR
jgi:poly-gamma-glutamate capsule biosynthesis protein CapA/YwtB (metallophosphatase superfamily)